MIREPRRVYRDEGFTSLVRKTFRFLYVEKFLPRYWTIKGRRTLQVGGLAATFHTKNREEAATIDYVHRNERPIIADMLQELRPDDVFFDIGANLGVHASFAAKRVTSGRVIAFEPYSPNIARLRANAKLNDCEVDLVRIPLWSSRTTVRFEQPEADKPGHQSASIVPETAERTIEREAVPGDELVEEKPLPQPTVVKIDVEGAEANVVEGLRETLSKEECRVVYCEVHLPTDGDRPAVTDFCENESTVQNALEELGFTTEIVQERPRDYHVKGAKNPQSG